MLYEIDRKNSKPIDIGKTFIQTKRIFDYLYTLVEGDFFEHNGKVYLYMYKHKPYDRYREPKNCMTCFCLDDNKTHVISEKTRVYLIYQLDALKLSEIM